MRKAFFALIVIGLTAFFAACDNYETYGEKKDKERAAIRDFISRENIKVIKESEFHAKGDVTDTAQNEFVYLDNDGVYMQIVHKGYGAPLANNERVTLIMRFFEMCIMDSTQVYNDIYPYDPDYMVVQRTGTSYSAYFLTNGTMYSTYGSAAVASGLLAPFPYINVGREDDETGHIAQVKLIVPHSKGHSIASGYVYPYYYEISFQRTY
jgi:hypothetical protein